MMSSNRGLGSREADLLKAVPLAGMRGVIARTMTRSLHEMAQLTLHSEVDAEPLLRLRESVAGNRRPSVTDLLLALTANTLISHRDLNATLEDGSILVWRPVHLGFAVAVDDGLVVPVIRNADRLSLDELQLETVRLTDIARTRGLKLADVDGATFTVTNLGAYGIDAFTPIINPPQVAILGVGRIRRNAITLSLTIDHRAVDGVPAARFLQAMAAALANPENVSVRGR